MQDPTTPTKPHSHHLDIPHAPRKKRHPAQIIVSYTFHPVLDRQILTSYIKNDQDTTFVYDKNYPSYLSLIEKDDQTLFQLLFQAKTTFSEWNYHVTIPNDQLQTFADMVQAYHYNCIKPITLSF